MLFIDAMCEGLQKLQEVTGLACKDYVFVIHPEDRKKLVLQVFDRGSERVTDSRYTNTGADFLHVGVEPARKFTARLCGKCLDHHIIVRDDCPRGQVRLLSMQALEALDE